MTQKISQARSTLLNECAKRIRTAIDQRSANLEKVLEGYDRALEHGDESEIEGAGSALVVYCCVDPVSNELRSWAKLDGMLKRAEGVEE